jgi:hypothetical protein
VQPRSARAATLPDSDVARATHGPT